MKTPVQSRIGAASHFGKHPERQMPMGSWLQAQDTETATGVPHRKLQPDGLEGPETTTTLRAAIVKHHTSPENHARVREQRALLIRQGFPDLAKKLKLLPLNDSTRKGNFAEIILSEYLTATGQAQTLVFRLRHNPNTDQSMKGDDVLAFRFDADRTELVVGEAKFRATPDRAVITEIAAALQRSKEGGLPASLLFVSEKLCAADESALGLRVLNCATELAHRRLRLTYAGFLLSTGRAAEYVHLHCPDPFAQFAMLSLSHPNPISLVADCYKDLD